MRRYALRIVAALFIAMLVGLAVYAAREADDWLESFILALAFPLPATLYALGYFYFLPELLGGHPASNAATPLDRRWSALLRVAAFLYTFCVAGILWLPDDWFGILAAVVSCIVAVLCIAVLCGVTLRYMGEVATWQSAEIAPPGGGTTRPSTGEKLGRTLQWLGTALPLKVSLAFGSVLILLSLYLGTTIDSGGTGESGYQIIAGEATWITAEHVGDSFVLGKQALSYLGLGTYVLGLGLAVLTIALLIAFGRRLEALGGRHLLVWTTGLGGALALFAISDLYFACMGVAVGALDSVDPILKAPLAVPFVCCLLSLALWYRFALAREELVRARWQKVRSSLIVLWLPFALSALGFMVLPVAFGAFGYASYFVGILMLWWGYVQLGVAERRGDARSS